MGGGVALTLLFISPMKNTRRLGFTLIELLVVIAIIAILAAILFPVFARARENARRSSCQSNLKQIGLGILQYTQDYDEKYPMRQYGNVSGSPSNVNDGKVMSWRRAIYPYVKSSQLFTCPSNTNAYAAPDDSVAGDMTTQGLPAGSPVFKCSYAINGNSNGFTAPSEHHSAQSLAAIPSTATTILVSEYSWVTAEVPFNYGAGNFSLGNDIFAFKGHLGTTNFLFCDGHVKALKPYATINPLNMWSCEEDGIPAASTNLPDAMANWQKVVEG